MREVASAGDGLSKPDALFHGLGQGPAAAAQ